MINLTEIVNYLNEFLAIDDFTDYGPNGLQVEGKAKVARVVTGVTASGALIDQAIALKADVLLVHHGWFWQKENPRVVGIKRERLKKLLQHDISLIGYHLPLDYHLELGNNILLADLVGLDFKNTPQIIQQKVFYGELSASINGKQFAKTIAKKLNREPFYIPGKNAEFNNIAWLVGGAPEYIEYAINAGADAFLTGEVNEQVVHISRETGMHFYAAGHHATERYGIQALGEHIAKKFGLDHQFVDIDNPV